MRRSACVLALLASASPAQAVDYGSYRLVPHPNGVSAVDFTGDGVPDLIVSGLRNNYNAHSFEVVTLYVRLKDGNGNDRLNLVPLFGAGGVGGSAEQLELTVSGGADCVLHDFRLLVGPRKDMATLVRADRDDGKGFADAAQVTFTYFDLKTNAGLLMAPTYYFQQVAVVKSQRSYCDVNDALSREAALAGRPDP